MLILLGSLDIAYMIWCIANQVPYSSSLNVFALIGGVLLFRGGLRTARWVATLSTFLLAGCGGLLLVVPFLYPWGYWRAVLRHGSSLIVGLAVALALLAILLWVRHQVLHPEVCHAQAAAGLPPPRTKWPLALGLAIPVLAVVQQGFMFHGVTAREAIRRGKLQCGERYQYVVTGMQMSSNAKEKSVSATVAAYNDSEIRSIDVAWKE